ncbi:MAG: hypothetical protein LBJ02_08890, partial [Bifidobacteriaceae bacterium]|nr:hypothetical protein [Bifidobacteriaceae bacterium]
MAAPRRKRAERPKAPPAPPRGKITLETPPELPPSDEPSALLASLLPMAGSLMSAVMVLMSGSGLSSYLGAAMFVL